MVAIFVVHFAFVMGLSDGGLRFEMRVEAGGGWYDYCLHLCCIGRVAREFVVVTSRVSFRCLLRMSVVQRLYRDGLIALKSRPNPVVVKEGM